MSYRQGPPSLTFFLAAVAQGGSAQPWVSCQSQGGCGVRSSVFCSYCGSTVRRLSPIHLSPTVKWHLCKLALKLPDKLSPTVAPCMSTKGLAVPFPLLTIQLFRDPQSCEGVLTFVL